MALPKAETTSGLVEAGQIVFREPPSRIILDNGPLSFRNSSNDTDIMVLNDSGVYVPSTNIYPVRAYGAKVDGTTEDTEAIQAIIDYLLLNHIGGIIDFPIGTCLIGQRGLVVRPSTNQEARIIFRGPGPYSGCLLRPISEAQAPSALIDVDGTDHSIARIDVVGLGFSGRAIDDSLTSSHGVRMTGTSIFKIAGSSFESLNHGIHLTTGLNPTSVGEISSNVIGSNNLVGIWSRGLSEVRIVNNDLQEGRVGGGATSYAIYFEYPGDHNIVSDNVIADWEGYAVYLLGSSDEGHSSFSNNDIDNTGGGYFFNTDYMGTIVGGEIRSLKAGAGPAVYFYGKGGHITGTTISKVTGTGITIRGDYFNVNGVTIRNPVGPGIEILSASHGSLTGNVLLDTRGSPLMTYGVTSSGTSDYTIAVGNRSIGGSTGDFSFVGTHNVLDNL